MYFGYLASGFEWVSVDGLPVVEDALWEGLSLGESAEVCCEPEGLGDGEVGSYLEVVNSGCCVTRLSGVPATCSSSTMMPLRWLRQL